MTNAEKIEAIRRYQNNDHTHPLTCGNGGGAHGVLEGKEIDGQVVLVCDKCDYVQTWVPEMVYTGEYPTQSWFFCPEKFTQIDSQKADNPPSIDSFRNPPP